MKENESKYRQLAYFSVILAEVLITPSVGVAIGYYLFRGNTVQLIAMMGLGGAGLLIAFYRIRQLKKKMENPE